MQITLDDITRDRIADMAESTGDGPESGFSHDGDNKMSELYWSPISISTDPINISMSSMPVRVDNTKEIKALSDTYLANLPNTTLTGIYSKEQLRDTSTPSVRRRQHDSGHSTLSSGSVVVQRDTTKHPKTSPNFASSTISGASTEVIILTDKFTDSLRNVGTSVSGLRVNIVLVRDTKSNMKQAFGLLVHAKSIWFVVGPVVDDAYVDHIMALFAERRRLCKNSTRLHSVLDIRLLLVDGRKRSDLPPKLHHFQTLAVKDNAGDLADILLKDHLQRRTTLLSIASDSLFKDIFLYVSVTLKLTEVSKVSKTREGEETYLEKSCQKLRALFSETSTAIRQYLQRRHRCPHVLIVEENVNSSDGSVMVQLQTRPCASSFLDAVKDQSLNNLIKENLKDNNEPFKGEVVVEISDSKSSTYSDLVKIIEKEEKVQQGLKIKAFFETDEAPSALGLDKPSREDLNRDKMVNILMEVLDSFLQEKTRTTCEFLDKLPEEYKDPNTWLSLRNSMDYSLMHLAVLYGREDYLKLLYYMGNWNDFRQDVCRPQPSAGADPPTNTFYTARRVAESLSFKDIGQEMLNAYDRYDALWRSLGPLAKACLKGDMALVQCLVEMMPELVLEETDAEGSDCLFYACATGNVDIVKYLLKKNANPDRANDNKETCVVIAATYGHLDVLEELSRYTFNIKGSLASDAMFHDAVDHCALTGNQKGLNFFHKKKVLRIHRLSVLVTLAAMNMHHGIVDYLLGLGEEGDVSVNKPYGELDRTPIHFAAVNADRKTFRLLVDRNADVTLRDKQGNSILHMAVESESEEMVRFVLDYCTEKGLLQGLISSRNMFTGQDLFFTVLGKDQGRRAWHWVELNRLLLHKFKVTMKSGQIDVMRFGRLYKSGFGSGEDDETKETKSKLIKDRLEDGKPDMSPLHVALTRDQTRIASLLLDNGADPNIQDHFGATSMHYACMYGNNDVLKALESKNADFEAKTDSGKTPLNVAEDNDQILAVNFLEARLLFSEAQNFSTILGQTEGEISEQSLSDVRSRGSDVRRHIIDTLRNLNISINQTLQDLGSGPVLESSN